jgi:chemotaxis protein MotB
MAPRPIIIVKKKGGHGGHHGGAWKVAYADFVTAMMALFIVLWLLNSSKQVREAVGGYFKDPSGKYDKVGNGTTGKGQGENIMAAKENMDKLKEELQAAMQKMKILDKLKDQVEMTITPEGLRIELLETEKGTFFSSGKSEPSDDGRQIMTMMAQELGQLPNRITIEGHTDSRPYPGRSGYTNWELSADRANSARRVMQQNGVPASQVTEVRGYADQCLRNAKDPEDPANRRVSVIVRYKDPSPTDQAAPGQLTQAVKDGRTSQPPPPAQPEPPAAGDKPQPTGEHGQPSPAHGEEKKPSPAPPGHK